MSRDERSATPGADGVRRSVILAAMRWCVVLVLAACGRIGFDATTDAGPMGPCPSGYDLIAGHCYRSVEVGAGGECSWLDAEEECEADGPGAHLAVIDDAEEAQRFTEGMVEQDSWIGISDRITEGTFITVTGAAAFTAWDEGEPSVDGDCVEIQPNGLMYVVDCGVEEDYVCEYDAVPADPTAF